MGCLLPKVGGGVRGLSKERTSTCFQMRCWGTPPVSKVGQWGTEDKVDSVTATSCECIPKVHRSKAGFLNTGCIPAPPHVQNRTLGQFVPCSQLPFFLSLPFLSSFLFFFSFTFWSSPKSNSIAYHDVPELQKWGRRGRSSRLSWATVGI